MTTTKASVILARQKEIKTLCDEQKRSSPLNLSALPTLKQPLPVYFTMLNGVLMWEYFFSKRKEFFSFFLLFHFFRVQLILCFSCKLAILCHWFTPKHCLISQIKQKIDIKTTKDNYINDTLRFIWFFVGILKQIASHTATHNCNEQ